MHRISREGFLQKRIYPSFGYYPWECSVCGCEKLYKNRGERRSRRRRGAEAS